LADPIQPINPDVKSREEIIDVVYDGKTEREKFIKELRAYQRKCVIAHQPFSYRAAKDAFIEEQTKQWSKNGSRAGDSVENVKVDKFNFSKYADKSRFKLLRKTPINAQKLIDGIRTNVETGMWHDFQDKNNGHKISVEVPHESPVKKD
jgi:hypothetical protein